MTNTTGVDPHGMRLLVDEPTTTLTKGELSIETDSFTLETSAGNFRFYLRADGSIMLSGDRVAVRAAGSGVLVLEAHPEAGK